MCGRYYISDDMAGEIQKLVQDLDGKMAICCSGDVYPSGMATVLLQHGNRLEAADMRWGFPGFDGKSLIINGRSDHALEKRTFKESVLHRRCVIPACGFYEWNARKEKFRFQRMDHAPVLFMAGCFNSYDGENRFVILTTQANESMTPVHDRMPLILEKNEIESWLSEDDCVEAMLQKSPPPLERSTEYEQLCLF